MVFFLPLRACRAADADADEPVLTYRAVNATLAMTLALLGIAVLAFHAHTPGARGLEAKAWPEGSMLDRDPFRPTLLLFLHHRCPCSVATLSELENLLNRQNHLRTVICFVAPDNRDPDWEQRENWLLAKALPGVEVRLDLHGAESRRFGAMTSGHVCLYSADGRLRFSGGITPSRGHPGESAGRTSIEHYLARGEPLIAKAPVYGCPLLSPEEREISDQDWVNDSVASNRRTD